MTWRYFVYLDDDAHVRTVVRLGPPKRCERWTGDNWLAIPADHLSRSLENGDPYLEELSARRVALILGPVAQT